MTSSEKRIETVKLLQRLREGDEKPGDIILRALRALAVKPDIDLGAYALIAALDEEAPRIASDKHHLFKFDHAVARRVFRRAFEAALRHSDSD